MNYESQLRMILLHHQNKTSHFWLLKTLKEITVACYCSFDAKDTSKHFDSTDSVYFNNNLIYS